MVKKSIPQQHTSLVHAVEDLIIWSLRDMNTAYKNIYRYGVVYGEHENPIGNIGEQQ
jgi:hypothetical protein